MLLEKGIADTETNRKDINDDTVLLHITRREDLGESYMMPYIIWTIEIMYVQTFCTYNHVMATQYNMGVVSCT